MDPKSPRTLWEPRARPSRMAPFRSYFGAGRLEPGVLVRWLALSLLVVALIDGFAIALGRPVFPAAALREYQENPVFTLFIALVVGPPLWEFAYRGLGFEMLRTSRAGSVGAVVVPAVVGTFFMLPYGWDECFRVITFGLLLGLARLRTDSLLLCIVLHCVANAVSVVELLLGVR